MTILLLLSLGSGSAQWGLRTTILHGENITWREKPSFLIGLDKNMSARSAMSLDFTYKLNLDVFRYIVDYDNISGTGSTSGSRIYYKLEQRTWGFTYASSYFFRDNDRISFYMGPFLGFRLTTVNLTPRVVYNSSVNQPYFPPTEDAKYLTFPMGIRFGVRSALSGFTTNAYLSLGYQVRAGSFERPYYISYLDKFAKPFFQLGYTFGIGWKIQ